MSQTFIHWPKDTARTVLANCAAFLERLPTGKKWKVEISEYRETRSDLQNKALWGCAYKAIGEVLGYDRDDLEALHHRMLCDHFGSTKREVMGEVREVPNRTSSKLTTVEFAEFYNFIQRKAAEYGVYVPDPDPFWREQRAA